MLHILTKSPFNFDIQSLFLMVSPLDDIIAIQDGILLAVKKNIFLHKIIKYSVNLYVLHEDAIARGLIDQVSSLFKIIDYSGFVQLTVKNFKQITW